MSGTTISKNQNGGNPYAGGSTFSMTLDNVQKGDIVTRMHFLGRVTGSITVNAKFINSDRFETIGTIDLSANGTLICEKCEIVALEFVDAGSGTFYAIVTQGAQ